MLKSIMLLVPALGLLSSALTFAEPNIKVSKVKSNSVQVSGENFRNAKNRSRFKVKIYKNGNEVAETYSTSSGSLRYQVNQVNSGNYLKFKAIDWFGKGNHWESRSYLLTGEIDRPGTPAPRPKLFVKAGFVKSGTVDLEFDAKNKSGRSQVNFYVNGSYKNNTFVNLPRDRTSVSGLSAGDKLEVKVLQFYSEKEHWSYTFQLKADPNAVPDHKIRDYANQQARTVANRVAATYGKYENWKYNFSRGYLEAFHAFKDNRRAFSRGEDRGENEVGNAGLNFGRSDAQAQAASTATGLVNSRFRAILNSGDEPDSEMPIVETPSYTPGNRGDRNFNVDQRLSDLDSELQSEMQRLYWNHGQFEYRYDRGRNGFNLRDVHRYSSIDDHNFVDSYFRADYAYSEWKNNRLGGGYDYNIYNKLDQSKKSYYQSQFKKIYNQVIDEKYNRVKYERNYRAYNRGEYYGEEVGLDHAFQNGRGVGYRRIFVEDAKRSFAETYENAYEIAFTNRVEYLNNNAVVEISGISLKDSNRNNAFEAGEALDVVIKSVINIGRVASDAKITVTGSILEDQTTETLVIEPSSRNAKEIVFKNLASVSPAAKQNTDYSVNLKVGRYYNRDITFSLSWAVRIREFAKMTSRSSGYKETRKYILDQISNEWKQCLEQKKNWYRKGIDGKNTLMEQLAEAHLKLPKSERDNTRGLYSDIDKIRKSGGGWHPFRRGSFKSHMKKLRK